MRREKKEYLSLYTLFFKDDNIIKDLLKNDIKVIIIYKDLDELLDNYYYLNKRLSERYFNVIIILLKDFRIISLYLNMIGKVFGARILYLVTIASK